MLPLHPNSSKTVNIEPKTQSEELDLLKSFPFTYIRKQIRDKVTDTLWLDDLQRIYDDVEKMKNNPHHEWERCAICTLPYGTCKHTTEWIHEKEESKVVEAIKTEVERDIDDIMDILSPTNKIENIGSPKKTNCVEIDPYGLKWYQLEQRLSDKIGSDDFCLSAPPPRGWHSTVVLGSRYTVVYGGLRFRYDVFLFVMVCANHYILLVLCHIENLRFLSPSHPPLVGVISNVREVCLFMTSITCHGTQRKLMEVLNLLLVTVLIHSIFLH